ncbi:MAG TPA: threonine synthase [Myxococcales bacterium]|nr:threonine synthase [Myxococcales bacterium]
MGLEHASAMTCIACGRTQRVGPRADCPDCGAENALEVTYDLEEVARTLDRPSLERREPWMWRFKELLPIDELADLPPLQVGMTPVYGAPRLASWLGLRGLWLKDESRAPSGSIDDRFAALAAVRAGQKAARRLALATRGPAAASLACFAAAIGARAVVFQPADAPADRLAGAAVFDPVLLRVSGSLEDARRLCLQAGERHGWYLAGGPERPYLAEGLKTAGLEIAEQLGERMPDWIAVGVGDGETLAALHKGLREMHALGLARSIPKLLGVQARACAPLVTAFESGAALVPTTSGSSAASRLCVEAPKAWRKALAAVRGSGGVLVAVDEAEIAEATRQTARLGAVAADPSAACAIAGLRRAVAQGIIGGAETALAVLTAFGQETGSAAHPIVVSAQLDEFEHQARSNELAID